MPGVVTMKQGYRARNMLVHHQYTTVVKRQDAASIPSFSEQRFGLPVTSNLCKILDRTSPLRIGARRSGGSWQCPKLSIRKAVRRMIASTSSRLRSLLCERSNSRKIFCNAGLLPMGGSYVPTRSVLIRVLLNVPN